jgi:hypothetical protein
VTANPGPDLTKYEASVEGVIYQNKAPVASGHVFVFDLTTYQQSFDAAIGSDGKYAAGVNAGQYLVFPVTQSGWRGPAIGQDFSSYINVQAGPKYRMDVDLNNSIPSGEQLVFGFVTSSANSKPVAGATVSAGGRSTATDGYGFYSMTVPSGTGDFTVSSEGFHDLHQNTHSGQADSSYFSTPFFKLNPIGKTGSSMGGVVRDISDGTGLGGVRITLSRPEDPNFVPVKFLTNLGGEYKFFNLVQGIYKLNFERPGYVSGTRDGLVVKDQDDAIINVFMNRDNAGLATVWGYVNNAALPLPVGGARVTLSNPLLGSYIANTQPTGYYNIANVIPSDYTITVVALSTGATTFYDSANSFQTIVAGDNRIDFNLRFIDEGVLRGTVSIAGGSGGPMALPPTGVEVTAEKVGGPLSGVKFKTATDGQGVFVFNGIPMGIYVVRGSVTFDTLNKYYGQMTGIAVNSGSTTNIDLQIALE